MADIQGLEYKISVMEENINKRFSDLEQEVEAAKKISIDSGIETSRIVQAVKRIEEISREARDCSKRTSEVMVEVRVELAEYKTRLNIVYGFISAIILSLIGIALKIMAGGG